MTNPQIYDLITAKISEENVFQNEPMKKHTSFKIGGNADFLVKAKSEDDVRFILELCKKHNIMLTVIGNGSNLLVSDNGVRGIVLKVCIDNLEIDKLTTGKATVHENNIIESKCENNTETLVRVGSGVLLSKLAFQLLNESLSGFEFASGIPGTIGGAIRMNAGAYGSEFKDIVVETKCMDYNGNIIVLNNDQQKFEYRNSIFKDGKYIILEAVLRLKYVNDNSVIKEKMDEYKKSRLEKQPIQYPSAGSTFKRGNDFITAKLIDECGLRGYSIGGAMVSEKHAGFVINTGNATSEDVLKLIDVIKEKVFKQFGKKIELEIEIVGKEE